MKDYDTYKFLKLLDEKVNCDIKYHNEGEWLVIDGDEDGDIILYGNTLHLPDYIKFNNIGSVDLENNNLITLPNNIEFNSKGYINLSNNKLTSLPNGIEFNNGGLVNLSHNKLTSISNIKFNNNGKIYIAYNSLESLPDNIDEFYNRLDDITKEYISKKFPDHWVVNKERFGL